MLDAVLTGFVDMVCSRENAAMIFQCWEDLKQVPRKNHDDWVSCKSLYRLHSLGTWPSYILKKTQ